MVRAKFVVNKIEDAGEGGKTIWLNPVVDGSDENKAFFKYTPGGQIILSVVNPAASDQFEEGKFFYVDFTETDDVPFDR